MSQELKEINPITEMVRKNIVLARKLRSWKQSDVAEKLKVTTQSVSEWERGNAEPGHKKLQALGKALGLAGEGLWFYQNHGTTVVPQEQAWRPEVSEPSDEEIRKWNRIEYKKARGITLTEEEEKFAEFILCLHKVPASVQAGFGFSPSKVDESLASLFAEAG